ncbi:MAG: hypothetical protein J5605_09605 [Bacteroidales bacterium]|jgi:hypothetical protein|nr:hypothetical protein [Bacteroidales bacterium]
MKKFLLLAASIVLFGTAFSQNLSQRAISARMKTFARPEYMVKDIKYYTDTMTVVALSEYVIYPLGKYSKIENYVHRSRIDWYRESGYRDFFDTMHVSVNTLSRLDGSHVDAFIAINTNKMEIVDGFITDTNIVLQNGIKVGMTKEEVFSVFFETYPRAYLANINVLRVSSGASEISEIYTFRGKKLKSIGFVTRYKYY